MTEEQIENKVSRLFDLLDAQFMRGKFSQAEYDDKTAQINEWAKRQYDAAPIFVRG